MSRVRRGPIDRPQRLAAGSRRTPRHGQLLGLSHPHAPWLDARGKRGRRTPAAVTAFAAITLTAALGGPVMLLPATPALAASTSTALDVRGSMDVDAVVQQAQTASGLATPAAAAGGPATPAAAVSGVATHAAEGGLPGPTASSHTTAPASTTTRAARDLSSRRATWVGNPVTTRGTEAAGPATRPTPKLVPRPAALPASQPVSKPVSTPVVSTPPVVQSVNPMARASLFADPTSSAALESRSLTATDAAAASWLASVPQVRWVTPTDGLSHVATYLAAAAAAGRTPSLALYGLPDRDCGSYSAGGASSSSTYLEWVASLRAIIADRPVIVIVEPDGLATGGCSNGLSALTTRVNTVASTVDILSADPATSLYLDIGHEGWLSPAVAAATLRSAHVSKARGFSVNVSNFYTTAGEVAYAEQVSAALGGSHYVIDTSRNGAGPAPAAPLNWCNPTGRSAGHLPGAVSSQGGLDGYLWVKHPGESDGACRTDNPTSGQWYSSWVVDFVARTVAAGLVSPIDGASQ